MVECNVHGAGSFGLIKALLLAAEPSLAGFFVLSASAFAAGAAGVGTEAEGNPCGFCKVMTSSLESMSFVHTSERDSLLERDIFYEVAVSFHAFGQEYIPSRRNCNDM